MPLVREDRRFFVALSLESACHACMSTHSTGNVQRAAMPRDVARKHVQMKEVRMTMMYDAFLDQMKKDLEADLSGICGYQEK